MLGTKEGLSVRGRLSFGAIAAFLGALLGFVTALSVWPIAAWLSWHEWVSTAAEFKWSVVVFVSAYCGMLGLVHGPRAGDVLGEAFSSVAVFTLAGMGVAAGVPAIDGDLPRSASEQSDLRGAAFRWKPAPLLTLLAGVLILGLFGPW